MHLGHLLPVFLQGLPGRGLDELRHIFLLIAYLCWGGEAQI
jgi:hypothetical protein